MKKYATILATLLLISSPALADISVGLAVPLTGPMAVLGEQARHGMEQAIADINAQGGINGEKLVMVVGDDGCDPKQAVEVANQFVSKGVKFVMGHACSGASIASSKVYAEEGIMMVSPASTNPALTESGYKNVFRVCGRDDAQGAVQGNYMLKHFSGKRVAIIHDNSTGGKGQAEQFKKTLNAGGVKEILFESYATGQRDYSSLITKLKNMRVQVLDIGGMHTEAALIVRQLNEQAAHIQVIGGDALVTEEFWKITGPAGEGVLMTFGADPRKTPAAKSTLDALRHSGYEGEGYTLYSYAAVQVIAEGIRRAGKPDPVKAAEMVRKSPIKTVLGEIGFNSKGDVTGSTFVVYRWSAGKYAEVGN